MSTGSERPRRRLNAAERRAVIEQAATEVFATHGYQRASMEEIARRSGVSAPVVYDHFRSKRELHRRLLERHFADLREVWRCQLGAAGAATEGGTEGRKEGGEGAAGEPAGELRTADVHRAFDAWFRYIETHPYAWRMLFRDTTGDAAVRADHAAVIAESRTALLPFFARLLGLDQGPDGEGGLAAELAWEACRSALQGLALWWLERPEVPRERMVAAALDAVWTGFERSREQGFGRSCAQRGRGR